MAVELPSGTSRRSLRAILAELQLNRPEDAIALDGDIDRDIAEVRLIDSTDQLDEVGAGALVVLDRRLSHIADGYLMDVAVRRAVSREVAGLMLTAPEGANVSLTARSMCRKSGLALVRLSPDRDLNTVLNVVAQEIADELHLTMERVRRVVDAIDRLAGEGSTPTDLATIGSSLLGYEIRVTTEPPEEGTELLAVPAIVNQPEGEQFVSARLPDADANTLLEMVLWRLAAETSRTAFITEQAERTNMLSVDEVLRQLLGASRETRDDLSPQARKLGIPVDAWHIVGRFELDIPQEGIADGLLAYETRERLARIALTTASTSGGIWHTAQEPAALWLLHSHHSSSPPRDLGLRVHRLMGSVLAALQHAVPSLRAYVGIGGVHAAMTGIAGSATEAKVAATHARSLRRANHPISFDAVGIRSTIVEWFGSPTVQESVDALFAPLDKVSQARRDETIEILGTYLDFGGSVARTAEAIHLHRNGVRARLQRAIDLIGVDIDDPDQRLFLHLACRAHRIVGTSHS
ncbi:PucR family transcriptional regulator [Haloechinothrix alba]|uniref:PucR family transcriptional regulator n=1 Tax=Haloechinothrix alba TaxID=664784 RepID=UPI00159614D1|nr:helix-turn-helix domain-containing protein [Haloechinothrix alba]